MRMSRHLIKKEKELIQRYNLLSKSLEWWEDETNATLGKMDVLDNQFLEKGDLSPEDSHSAQQLTLKLRNLLGRCDMERKNMDMLEEEVKSFLNQKNIIKNAPHR